MTIDPFERANFNEFSVKPKPIVTKDGVSVARQINLLQDQMENIGARLLIDAAEQANELSGDGTTTCTVVAQSILEHGQKLQGASQSNRINMIEYRKGILDAVKFLSEELSKLARPVKSTKQIR